MEQRKTESINQFTGRVEQWFNRYEHYTLVGMIGVT